MNKFDEVYDIRLANENDIDQIMSFIDAHWYRKNHILAKNRSFFEYEFLEPDGTVNVVIAVRKQSNSIEGMAGILKASHKAGNMDIWGCMWRVREGNLPMLGMEIERRLGELLDFRYNLGLGLRPSTALPLLRDVRKYAIGKLKHYYYLGETDSFKVAVINHLPSKKHIDMKSNIEIKEIKSCEEIYSNFDAEKYMNVVPFKDVGYIDKRFFRHPVYDYIVYGLYDNLQIGALLITREEKVEDRVVLRIVDYIGEHRLFSELGGFFDTLVRTKKYEYIDFYCLGFEEEYILDAGFTLRTEDDTNIIPDHFHPFEQQNIEIWAHAPMEGALFFKADGDQDRPN